MVTTTKPEDKPEGAARKGDAPVFTTPIVIEAVKTKSGKKKKRKYTRGTKGVQRFTLGLAEAGSRVANSFGKGSRRFVKESKKSSRKRKDGLVRDSLRNASDGFSDAANEFGKAPGEVARRISTKQVRRTFRILTPINPFR